MQTTEESDVSEEIRVFVPTYLEMRVQAVWEFVVKPVLELHIVQKESYTSRANFVGLDPIPVYGKTEKEPMFTDKRIKRGLYKTSVSQLINSDVNGAYNILRKAIPNAFSNGIESCVVRALRGSIRSK